MKRGKIETERREAERQRRNERDGKMSSKKTIVKPYFSPATLVEKISVSNKPYYLISKLSFSDRISEISHILL